MKSINHQQLFRLCANAILCSPPLSWLQDLQYGPALTKLSLVLNHLRTNHLRPAYVLRGMSVGLNALASSATVNLRIYVGLVFIWVLAPLSLSVCHLFDKTILDFTWYHVNYYYLFNALGPYMGMLFALIGFHHIFTPSIRTYAVSIPMVGYILTKIVKIIVCTNNIEWHAFPSFEIIVIGFASSVILILSIDWFAWRKYHKFDSIPARIKGIISVPGIDAETKLKLIEKENQKLFTFHKEY